MRNTSRSVSCWRMVSLLVGIVASIAGCGGSGLQIEYPETSARPGMLAASPVRVEIGPVIDRRVDTSRIGIDEKKKDLGTSRPVVDIVRDALVVEARRNGYTIASDPRDAVLAADVEEFWVDTVRGYSRLQYVGRVALKLSVTHGQSGQLLLSRRYVGITRREVDQASTATVRDVMDLALARALRDLATDQDLVAAFARARVSASRETGILLKNRQST